MVCKLLSGMKEEGVTFEFKLSTTVAGCINILINCWKALRYTENVNLFIAIKYNRHHFYDALASIC